MFHFFFDCCFNFDFIDLYFVFYFIDLFFTDWFLSGCGFGWVWGRARWWAPCVCESAWKGKWEIIDWLVRSIHAAILSSQYVWCICTWVSSFSVLVWRHAHRYRVRLYLLCKTGQIPNRPKYELLVVCAKVWVDCYCFVSIEALNLCCFCAYLCYVLILILKTYKSIHHKF